MRRYFFGDDGSTAWRRDEAGATTCRGYRHVDADIRDEARDGRGCSPGYGRDIALVIHTAAQPSHDWAAREPITDFTVNANGTLVLLEMTRRHCPDAPFIFTSTNKVYGDTPEPAAARRARDALGGRRRPPVRGHGIDETMSIDADDAQRVRRLEGRGRRHGAGVRALLRPEDGVLPRRLPDRPGPFRRRAARLPVLSGEVRGHRPAVHGLRLQGQAGPRQHPLVRPGERLLALLQGAAQRRGLQHRRRPGVELLDARGDRHRRAADRTAACSGPTATRTAPATTSGGSATSGKFASALPGVGADLLARAHDRGDPRRDDRARRPVREIADAARSAVARGVGGRRRPGPPVGRHPGPQRRGPHRRDRARDPRRARRGAASRTRSSSSTTTARTGPSRSCKDLRTPRFRRCATSTTRRRTGSASRCAPAWRPSRATPSRSSWPTARTRPQDLVAYYRKIEEGLRLRLRLALHARREDRRLSVAQADDEPAGQLLHPHAVLDVATTTSPTPSRCTGGRSSPACSRCSPITST